MVEFGECVWYFRLKSAGKDKMNTRWGSGVWLGIREESNEVFVGMDEENPKQVVELLSMAFKKLRD